MEWIKKHLEKIWGIGIGFVIGFMLAGWMGANGMLTGF